MDIHRYVCVRIREADLEVFFMYDRYTYNNKQNKKHVYDTYMIDQDMYERYIDTHIHMIDIQIHTYT